jgi:predicted O-methyltransferase YrrM
LNPLRAGDSNRDDTISVEQNTFYNINAMRPPLIDEILAANAVTDLEGRSYPLHSHVETAEGEMLERLIRTYRPNNALEIGCAYGLSSLYIGGAMADVPCPSLTIIDPEQTTSWRGIGAANLQRAGIAFARLVEKPSHVALPELLASGQRFEFIFVDGWHTVDQVMLDIFYSNLLLRRDGILVLDDNSVPPVAKSIRYLANYPAYRVVGSTPNPYALRPTLHKRVFEWIMRPLVALLPDAYRGLVFRDEWLRPDWMNLNAARMVAFQRIAADDRSWNWYPRF